jgi:hypothetical protein
LLVDLHKESNRNHNMSASSVSSNTAHVISPEAIAAWNDLTVSAPDGRVRVVTLEAVSTKAQRNAPSGEHGKSGSPGQTGQPDLVGPMPAPAPAPPLQAANDPPAKPAELPVVASAPAKRQPAADDTALLDFALGLCEQSESAHSTESINAAPEPGGVAVQPAQGLPVLATDKPDATVSPSLATQPKGEPHAGI